MALTVPLPVFPLLAKVPEGSAPQISEALVLMPKVFSYSFIFFSAFSFHLISQFHDTPYRQPFKYTPCEYAVRICSCKCVF